MTENVKTAIIRIDGNVASVQTNNNGVLDTEYLGEINEQFLDSCADFYVQAGYTVSVIEESRDSGM